MKFRCWDPDNEDETDAREVDAFDTEEAAELHAEHIYDRSGEHFDRADIRVRDVETGAVVVVRVVVDFSPNFHGTEAKP